TGVVRSWKEPYSMVGRLPQGEGPREVIEPSEWGQRAIDLMTDADGCNYFVNVSNADLGHWLNRNGEDRLRLLVVQGSVGNAEWATFSEAVGEVERELGMSQSEAEVVLSQAIAGDKIRSISSTREVRAAAPFPPIEPEPERAERPEVELWVHIRNE